MNFFRSFLSFCDNIHLNFASPPKPEKIFGIPSGSFSVADYFDCVVPHLNPSRISDLVIKEIVMGKVNNLVGHEFLVFKLQLKNRYLTVERETRPEDIAVIFRSDDPLATLLGREPNDLPIDERAALTKEVAKRLMIIAGAMKALEDIRAQVVNPNRVYDVILPGPPPYWSNVKKGSKRDVKDQVPEHGKFKLYTYRILPSDTQPVFSMREVAIIANVIHENKLYNWGDRNCYWFAATMMAVIEKLIKTEKITHPGAKWAGRPVSSKLESLAPARQSQASDISEFVDQAAKAIKKADDDMKERLKLEEIAQRIKAEAKTRQAEERTEALKRETEA